VSILETFKHGNKYGDLGFKELKAPSVLPEVERYDAETI
jgi:hypothetical protein